MLYNIFYYGIFSSIICIGGGGILYMCDRELFNDIALSVSWESVKLYHSIKNNFNIIKDEKKKEEKNVLEIKSDLFLGYTKNNGNIFKTSNFDDKYIIDTSFDLMMVKNDKNKENNTYYKIIYDKADLKSYTIKNTGKIFLQVEIEQFGKRTSIHNFLEPFYVNNNKILDEVFLKWYLQHFYNMILSENYTIHIIDSNINMFTIKKQNAIVIDKKINNIDSDEYIYKIVTSNI
jgi:hypothetical protein